MNPNCNRGATQNITRIDVPERQNHCWFCRIQRNNHTYRKSFADKKWGGREEAFKLAQSYVAAVKGE